jgi:hypothetical protein
MKLDGGEPNVDGIELRLDVMTPRTDWWTTWAGLTLPDIGPASISGDISGGFPAARIDNLVISAGVADTVQVRATGSISSLDFGTSSGIANDVDLSFEARARNGAFVSTIVGRPIPFVDTITATGRFSGGGSRFAITEFLVENKGRGDFSMQARGSIGDVLAGHGVELHVTAAADSALLTNLATAGALGRLRLTGRVVDQGGAIGVEELRIWVEDNDAWAMEASGQIGDLRAADDISLRLRAEIPDPTAFSLTLGRQPTSLAALSFTGNLTGSIQQIEATGVAQIGATKLETIASGDFGGKRPAFVGRIHSERVDLADLGYDATDGPETKQNPSPAEHPSAGRMFPADPLPFDALGLAELKLEIMIEEVTGTALKIDRVISSIRLQDGVLDIDPLHFHFVGGNLVTNAQVHATGSTAALTISAEAHNLDLETAFRSLGAGDPMDGDLDLIAQFSANGDSPRALIESLDGTLDIAMSQGRVHGASFNIWSEDLLSWLLSAEAIQGNTPVHCLVVRLDTQGGRAKLDKFILDVPHQTIWGTGVIDLVGERVDLMFVPRHKGLALPRFTTPAAFRGPLAMPEIELDPVELTSDVLGRIVFSPITALGDFLTTITNSASAEDHGCAKN